MLGMWPCISSNGCVMGTICSTGGGEEEDKATREKTKLCAQCEKAGEEFAKEYDDFRKNRADRPEGPKRRGLGKARGVFGDLLEAVRQKRAQGAEGAQTAAPGGAPFVSLVPALLMRA